MYKAIKLFMIFFFINMLYLPNIIFGQSNIDDFIFNQNKNGTITITGYRGISTDVVIPADIDGIPITEIAASAFVKNFHEGYSVKDDRITSVIIPDSVIIIGNSAFKGNKLKQPLKTITN